MHQYDPLLLAASVAVAVLGGYTALELAERARSASARQTLWLLGAALALGIGIWSMHFLGMLALHAPAGVSYALLPTAISLLLAVGVSGAGLVAVAKGIPRRFTLACAGTLTGAGIAGMHYTGMAGMRLPVAVTYDPLLVAVSVAIAIAASLAALWLAFRPVRLVHRIWAGAVLGLAVVSMHYTGMAAADFGPLHDHARPPAPDAVTGPLLAGAVAAGTLVLLALGLATALLDRRRVMLTAAAGEAQHRAVVDTAVDPIVVIDERGVIQSFNRAAERTFGYTAEEAVGRNVRMLMPEPHRGSHDRYLGNYLGTGQRRIIGIGREVEGRRKDGSTFPLELSVAEWQAGNKRRFTGIMRDISERKAAEDALVRAKERAERADQAKTKFLAAASHDLRQPVQSLFFFAQAISERLQGHPTAELVASMSESLEALRTLLDSLLDVSKLDAGVVTPNVTDFALAPLFDRLATEYAPRAREGGLRLRVVPTTCWARTDPVLLERILRNLLENALRYTQQGGVLVGCRRRGGKLRLDVVDTGVGIPAADLDEIFEEFHQVANLERDRRKGLGLGLAIVRRLARLLGHAVTVRSRPGQGSGFSVELPAAAARVIAPAPARSQPANDGHGGLVVVIEDDAVILISMRAMLEDWGYEVAAALSAAEAIEILRGLGRAPDRIIADYRLGAGLDGVSAIRDIHGLCGVRVPAIVLTGDTDPARIAEVQGSGFRLLHKPVSPSRLREALQAA